MSAAADPIRFVVVSGLSGAGKSTALKLLEDYGYEAVDNLPMALLRRLAAPEGSDSTGNQPRRAIAVGIDSRTRDFQPDQLIALLGELRQRDDLTVQLLYFDCEDEVLLKRFTATRRRVMECSASYTTPIPPRPSTRSRRYLPAIVEPGFRSIAAEATNEFLPRGTTRG